ncbi:2-oxoglutarate receptor 1-like [Polypterus senegalus]|uniref:2-oxoglutarate receptor 1-like n=1 Tax=Polypterus senegalus TaxID=55291 RepID=UPI0019669C87|nr:2-oxoglutarate receptor 1-like [Polypterus senegalus]
MESFNNSTGLNSSYENHVNCSGVSSLLTKYFLPVAYAVDCGFAVTGNILAIFVYTFRMRPWKSNTVIMFNLAMADVLYVSSLPFFVYYYALDQGWTLGEFLCKFLRLMFHLNMYGGIMCLTCISVFRYIAVTRPMLRQRIRKKKWAIVACVIVWMIVLTELLPILHVFTVEYKNNMVICYDYASTPDIEKAITYSWVLNILGFLLPMVIVFTCYVSIARILTLGPCASHSRKIRARRLTIIILFMFIFCFMPYHIMRSVRLYSRTAVTSCQTEEAINAVYIVTRPLAGLSPCFNLIFYVLAGDNFQQALINLFKCQKGGPTSVG